ncbi:translation initiation factor eIF3 subunit g, partial [Cladochytrium tenue]
RWSDDVDEVEDAVPAPSKTPAKISKPSTKAPATLPAVEEDGIRIVVEIRRDDDGKPIKRIQQVTTKIRSKTVKVLVNPSIARRRQLRKFGDSAGLKPGPDSNSTSYGDKVFLKLTTTGKGLDDAAPAADATKVAALANSKIMCRICKGDHWTSKCPFKDTHQLLDAPSGAGDSMASLGGADESAVPGSSAAAAGGSKYVPPSLRGRGPGAKMDDMPASRRDDFFTLRITNLSEEVTEQDLKDLVGRFGHTARVFVARDRETNMCKGFAFVSFYSQDDANRCMNALNGFGYDNLILHVEIAKNRERD